MRRFAWVAVLVSAQAWAASPAKVQLDTSFQVGRGSYHVQSALNLTKDSDKKVEYAGRATIQNVDLPSDVQTVDADVVIAKKKDHYEGTFYFGGTTLYSFDFSGSTAVPTSGEALQAQFTLQQYDPGSPDDPVGGMWWPVARATTNLTFTYSSALAKAAVNFRGSWTGTGHLTMFSDPVIENDCSKVEIDIDHLNDGFLELMYQDYNCTDWEVEFRVPLLVIQDGKLLQDGKVVGSIDDQGFQFDATREDNAELKGTFKFDGQNLVGDLWETYNGKAADHYLSNVQKTSPSP
jgi:hypothetical protein